MSLRGRVLDSHSVHSSGLLQHGSYPYPTHRPTNHHAPPVPSSYPTHRPPPNHLPPPVHPHIEILERKLSTQLSEMRNLETENFRLASSHISMRQEILNSQKEAESIRAHLSGVKTEISSTIRGLYDKIKGFEAEMRVGDSLQVELQQRHMEAQALVKAREELGTEMTTVGEELERERRENRKFQEMCRELDGLRQEHQKLRSTFEYEKGTNIKQVEQMRGMEKNLRSMANEIEKLRADVASAEKRLQQANAAQNQAMQYQNQVQKYHQPVAQPVAYGNQAYTQGITYPPVTHYNYPVPAYTHAGATYQNAYVDATSVADPYSMAGYPVPAVHYGGYEPSGVAPASASKQA